MCVCDLLTIRAILKETGRHAKVQTTVCLPVLQVGVEQKANNLFPEKKKGRRYGKSHQLINH